MPSPLPDEMMMTFLSLEARYRKNIDRFLLESGLRQLEDGPTSGDVAAFMNNHLLHNVVLIYTQISINIVALKRLADSEDDFGI